MFGSLVKKLAAKHGYPFKTLTEAIKHDLASKAPGKPAGPPKKTKAPKGQQCRCRPAKGHRDCAYCGVGWDDGRVCGKCRVSGIDGKVIPGTSAVVCKLHKGEKS